MVFLGVARDRYLTQPPLAVSAGPWLDKDCNVLILLLVFSLTGEAVGGYLFQSSVTLLVFQLSGQQQRFSGEKKGPR